MDSSGEVIIPIILLSLYGREKKNYGYHLFIQALNVGGVAIWFKLMLGDLSCSREQDWACGMKEMSSNAIGVVLTKHPPAHILTCFKTCCTVL